MRSTSASDLDLIEARGAGGGVLPIMTYTGRLRPKGVSFSGFRSVWKGRGFTSWSIWNGREICHLGLGKGPKWLTDELNFMAL